MGIGLPPIGQNALPDPSSMVWLAGVAEDLELEARVIDYWRGGRPVSGALADYFRALGFEIPDEPVKRWQLGSSCGIVASDVVTTMRKAEEGQEGGWKDVDTTGATDQSIIKLANERQDEWADPSERLATSVLRRNPFHTRDLCTSEIQVLGLKSWRRVREEEPAENPGPPCARCDEDHASSNCPHFTRRRGRWESETVTVGGLDQAYAQISRDLHKMATASDDEIRRYARAPWPRYFISNTSRMGEGAGVHWFTIAYSIRRRKDPVAMED